MIGMKDIVRNPAFGSPPEPATTQVADGLPRRAWTVDEVERMVEVGILREPEPFELIGGELVAMAPKDRRHEVLRTELALYWADRRAREIKIAAPSRAPSREPSHPTTAPGLRNAAATDAGLRSVPVPSTPPSARRSSSRPA